MALQALVFDAYGTLFDVHSVTTLAERLVPGQGSALSAHWRAKQLEYSWLTSLMRGPSAVADFGAVTAQALDHALAALGSSLVPAERTALLDAYRTFAPFDDAAATLAALAPRPCWILSNGSRAMLEPLVAQSGLGDLLAGILSVEDVGVFKPSPAVYALAERTLGVPRQDVGFVSANGWDAAGATVYGFSAFWINRAGAPVERHAPPPARILQRLADLPEALAALASAAPA